MDTIHPANNEYVRYTTETDLRKKKQNLCLCRAMHDFMLRVFGAVGVVFNITYHSKLIPFYGAQFDSRCVSSASNVFRRTFFIRSLSVSLSIFLWPLFLQVYRFLCISDVFSTEFSGNVSAMSCV